MLYFQLKICQKRLSAGHRLDPLGSLQRFPGCSKGEEEEGKEAKERTGKLGGRGRKGQETGGLTP